MSGGGHAEAPARRRVVLRVEEVRVLTYSSKEAANWWVRYRQRGPVERFHAVTVGFPGDLIDVQCDDREHAEWLRDHMIDQGIPKAALKVQA